MYKNNIAKVVEEILDWAGPSGLCWCEDLQCFVDPKTDICSDCEPLPIIDEPPAHFLDPSRTYWSSKETKTNEIVNEILDGFGDWTGPSGKTWCEKLKRYVSPNENIKDCPECSTVRNDELGRIYRYLHLHDDYKSY